MSTPGIYMPNGDFIDFAEAKQRLTGEVATVAKSGLGFASWFGMLPDPDPVLRKRGDDAEVLNELVSDDEVSTAMTKRVLRTQNKSRYTFKPGHAEGADADESAKRICKQLENDLSKISSLRDLIGEILHAPYYGLTVAEIMWEPADGRMKLTDVTAKPREWFGFNSDRKLVLKTLGAPDGELCNPLKFLLARHGASYLNPYGVRLLSRCLWPVSFKRGGIEFWMRFVEKFGQPWVVAKGGKDNIERSEMAGQLFSMVQDAIAVLPANTDVQLVEASGKAGELHERFVRHWDRAVSKVLTGQTLATDTDGSGSRAASETHDDQLESLSEADEALLVDAMEHLARIYTEVNAAPGTHAPRFEFVEPEDYKARASLDKDLKTLGVRFSKGHFVEKYGLAEDEFDLEHKAVEPDPDPDPEAAPLDHTAPGHDMDPYQPAVDELADNLIQEAATLNKQWAEQLQSGLGKAESWEDLQLLLAETLGQDLDTDEQSDLLTRAMLNAGLAGQAGVIEEDADG